MQVAKHSCEERLSPQLNFQENNFCRAFRQNNVKREQSANTIFLSLLWEISTGSEGKGRGLSRTWRSRPLHFPLRQGQIPFPFSRAWQLYSHFPPCFQLQPTSSYLHILTERGIGAKKDLALLVGAVVHPRQLVREPHGILAPWVCHQQAGAHLGPGSKEKCPLGKPLSCSVTSLSSLEQGVCVKHWVFPGTLLNR